MSNSLLEHAKAVRENAYAPYSKFGVGAALMTKAGRIFVGCNVENRSFGLTTCAEQAALAAAIAAGETQFSQLSIVTGAKIPTMPCGRCRQLLAEFSPDLQIESVTLGGASESHSLKDLFPRSSQGILE